MLNFIDTYDEMYIQGANSYGKHPTTTPNLSILGYQFIDNRPIYFGRYRYRYRHSPEVE